jgi:hypothetical protein
MGHRKLQRLPDIGIAVILPDRRIVLEFPEVIVDVVKIWMIRATQQFDPKPEARIPTAHKQWNGPAVQMAKRQGGQTYLAVANPEGATANQEPFNQLSSGNLALDHHQYGQVRVVQLIDPH